MLSKEEAINHLLNYSMESSGSLSILKNFNIKEIPEEYFSDKEFVMTVLNGKEVDVYHNEWTSSGYEKVKSVEYKNNPYIYPLLSKELKLDKKVLNIVGMKPVYNGKEFKLERNKIKGMYDIFEHIPEELKSNYKLMYKFYAAGRRNDYEMLPEVLKKDVDIAIKYTTKMKGRKYYPDKVFKIPEETFKSDDFIFKYVSKINNNYNVLNLILDRPELMKKVILEVGSIVKDHIISDVLGVMENYNNGNIYLEKIAEFQEKKEVEKDNIDALNDRIEYYQNKVKQLNDRYNNIKSILSDDKFYVQFMINQVFAKSIDGLKYSNEDNDKKLYKFINLFDNKVIKNENNWREIIKSNYYRYELYIREYMESNPFNENFHKDMVRIHGNNIIHAPESLKADREFILECSNTMNSSDNILKELSKFKADEEVILSIIKKNTSSYSEINKDILTNKFIIKLLETNLDNYYNLDSDVKNRVNKNQIIDYYKKLELSENLTNEINQSKSKNKSIKI